MYSPTHASGCGYRCVGLTIRLDTPKKKKVEHIRNQIPEWFARFGTFYVHAEPHVVPSGAYMRMPPQKSTTNRTPKTKRKRQMTQEGFHVHPFCVNQGFQCPSFDAFKSEMTAYKPSWLQKCEKPQDWVGNRQNSRAGPSTGWGSMQLRTSVRLGIWDVSILRVIFLKSKIAEEKVSRARVNSNTA